MARVESSKMVITIEIDQATQKLLSLKTKEL